MKKRVFVLDTSAFLAGLNPFVSGEEQITTPKVMQEVKTNSLIQLRLRTALKHGILTVRIPSMDSLAEVNVAANKVGDSFFLSDTDKQILAVAQELKMSGYQPKIVTDDYSIQNVATQLKIEFCSLATLGIRSILVWVRYCPACHREYAPEYNLKECAICGTKLKRKVKSKPEKGTS